MNLFIRDFKKYMVFSLIILGIFAMFLNTSNATFGLDENIIQVKTADSPIVYYLNHKLGFKKAYISEEAYFSYGNKWSDVSIVSQEILDSWKTAYLVKVNNNPTVFYIVDNKKIAISNETEFNANGYKWEDIITVSENDINSYEDSEFMYYGGPNLEGAPAISIGTHEPTGEYVPLNTNDNLIASYIISAPDESIEIKEINIKVNGVYVSSDILKKAKLKIIGDSSSIAETDNPGRTIKFNLTRNPLLITAGSQKEIGVYLDLGFNDQISNQSFYATIERSSSIIADAIIKGNFPLNGKTLSLVDASEFFSSAIATQLSLTTKPEVVIGSSQEHIASYKIEDSLKRGSLIIEELVFKNIGNSDRDDFNNFKLKDQHNKIISTTANIIDNEVVFTINNYKIDKSGYVEFKVYSDIIGGEGEKIKIHLERAKIKSESYDYFLPIKINDLDEEKTIVREDIAVIAHNIEINEEVFKNEAGNLIGIFEIRSDNQGVKLKEVKLSLEKNTGAPSLEGNVFLVNYENGDVIDSIDANVFSNSITTLEFNNYSLDSRNKLKIGFVSKLSNSAQNGDTYKVIFKELTYENISKENITDSVEVSGDILKVGRSNLYIYDNDEDKELISTKGEEKVKIASFFLESSSGDDLIINSMVFVRSDGPGTVSYDNGFSNLKLYIGSRRVGNTIERPYSASHNFDGFSYTLRDGKRVEVILYADIDNSLKVDYVQLALSNITAISENAGTLTNIHNLNANSYKAVFNEASARFTNIAGGEVNPGEKENLVGTLMVENTGGEELKLRNIVIETSNDGFSYSRGYSNLIIKEKISDKKIGRVSKPVAEANEVSLGNYKIVPGAQVEFNVYVDASKLVGSGNYELSFRDLEARGSESGVYATISGDSSKTSGFINVGVDEGETISLVKPVPGRINYGFHDPDYPFKHISEHNAVDFSAFQGTYVKAAANGTVSVVVDGGATGYSYVTITHNDNFKTVYGHLSQINVSVGDTVSVNDTIGRSGGTPGTPGAGPNTSGPHLHFEVWHNGVVVDSEIYL